MKARQEPRKRGREMLKGRENPTPARAEKRRCQLHPESAVENAALLGASLRDLWN